MECPSLSYLINVCLKSILSNISIANPCLFGEAMVLVNLLPAFHPQPVVISVNEMGWVSYKHQIVASSFLIQFAKWFLLMGELSLLTFSVSIDSYVMIPVI
jgi:hypothetical protein